MSSTINLFIGDADDVERTFIFRRNKVHQKVRIYVRHDDDNKEEEVGVLTVNDLYYLNALMSV